MPLSGCLQIPTATDALATCLIWPTKSSLFRIFMDFVHTIQALPLKYITWLTGDLEEVADGFSKKTDMPSFVGCIDGTHISIRGSNSKNFRDSYINRRLCQRPPTGSLPKFATVFGQILWLPGICS